MRSLFAAALFAVAPLESHANTLRIVGETKYKPHQLVRLKAEGVDAKAALLWRVHPAQNVQRATTPRHILEFAAHPGSYEVELLVIQQVEGGLVVEEVRVSVLIEPCSPSPPKPDPKPPEGTSTAAIRRTRPAATTEEAWVPLPIPLRHWPQQGNTDHDDWRPIPIPIRVSR